jgi:hypothetical protein
MVTLFVLLAVINLVGAVVCHAVARSRGSRKVVFWTTMGVLFGPFAIPFVLKGTSTSHPSHAHPGG